LEITGLDTEICYEGSARSTQWTGVRATEPGQLADYIRGRVRSRLEDSAAQGAFAAELRGMATTGMATQFVEQLLEAVPDEPSWSIGEAFAECVLADDETREVVWPWNQARDKRTPKASLPGADLIGFCREGGAAFLLFGEVKTSTDKRTPPGVMVGRGGMTWQLGEEATRLDIQHALLVWLRSRCLTDDHLARYREAVGRYVASEGKALFLAGVLLRDTKPEERDISNRAKALARKLDAPTRIEVTAWYLPIAIEDWPTLLEGGAR